MAQHRIIHQCGLQAILKKSDVAEIRAIDLELQANRVVLRGVVSSFYYKQVAQELLKYAADDLEIDNRIRVEYTESEFMSDMRSITGTNDV